MPQRKARALARLAGAALGIVACRHTDAPEECVPPPCAVPIAVTITVTSSATHASVAGAFVTATTPFAGTVPCNQAPGTTCAVPGTIGTYELDVGAPGFQTVHRSVAVTGTTPRCSCVQLQTQHLDVALVPATPGGRATSRRAASRGWQRSARA